MAAVCPFVMLNGDPVPPQICEPSTTDPIGWRCGRCGVECGSCITFGHWDGATHKKRVKWYFESLHIPHHVLTWNPDHEHFGYFPYMAAEYEFAVANYNAWARTQGLPQAPTLDQRRAGRQAAAGAGVAPPGRAGDGAAAARPVAHGNGDGAAADAGGAAARPGGADGNGAGAARPVGAWPAGHGDVGGVCSLFGCVHSSFHD